MYYPCSENKGADQLRGYREADLRLCFRICKMCHDAAQIKRPIFEGSDTTRAVQPHICPTKKKRTSKNSLLSSPFNAKMLIVIEQLFLIKF